MKTESKVKNQKSGKVEKQKKESTLFTKDSTLGEVIKKKPNADAVLLGFGMHCFGCFVSQMETLEEASEVHGIDLDLLLKKLNEL